MSFKLEIKRCSAVEDGFCIVVGVTETPSWFGRLFKQKPRYAEFETPRFPKYTFWKGARTGMLLHELSSNLFLEGKLTRLARKEIANRVLSHKATEWVTVKPSGTVVSDD